LKRKRVNRILKAFAFGSIIYASNTSGRLSGILEITESKVIDKVVSGEFRGLSPAFIVRKWECSICHRDLEECAHEIGVQYGNAKCQAVAKDIEPIEVSIVKTPEDPRCRITDLLLIEEENSKRKYAWYGFEVNAEIDRLKSIQSALENKLIPEEAAFHFSEFFSNNLVGNTFYP